MKEIENFVNDQGQLTQWPAKHRFKQAAILYLSTKFETGRAYHELEINEILKQWHTFSDWPLLRRSLVDYGFLVRNIDGTEYKRVK